MRIDLHALVGGREEANDVTVARTAVEFVLSIEDDIFGAFNTSRRRRTASYTIHDGRPLGEFREG